MRTALVSSLCVLVAPAAIAGEVEAEIAADYFHATSSNTEPGSGAPADMVAHELAMRVRGTLLELDDRLKVRLDYQGREPIESDIDNATHRLLYTADIAYEVIEDTLSIGLGRFPVPAAVLLPSAGARAELTIDKLSVLAFGGRRGFTTSRRNVDFDRFLPAAGAVVAWRQPELQIEAAFAYSEDEALQLDGDEARYEDFAGVSFYLRASGRPIDNLRLGAYGSFLQQAAYTLGPRWNGFDVEVRGVDLFGANAFVDWRPLDWLRAGVDFAHQRAALVRAGRLMGTELVADDAPHFTDVRGKLAARPFDVAWLRASYRFRLRNDRTEMRMRFAAHADELGLDGLYAKGWLAYDLVELDNSDADHDRLLWSAALGYRGFGLDVSIGARYIDRASAPVSGRQFDGTNRAVPEGIVDLAPFTLDTQRIAFIRAFYSREYFFWGLDFEHSLDDTELRAMVQIGTLWEAAW